MRDKIVDAIATIDVFEHIDVRTVSDVEYAQYVDALRSLRELLFEVLRIIDAAARNN